MENFSALIINTDKEMAFSEDLLDLSQFTTIKHMPMSDATKVTSVSSFNLVICSLGSIYHAQLEWIMPLARENKNTRFLLLAQQISILAYRDLVNIKNL